MTPFEWATHVDRHTQKYIDMVARRAKRIGWWRGLMIGTCLGAAVAGGTIAVAMWWAL